MTQTKTTTKKTTTTPKADKARAAQIAEGRRQTQIVRDYLQAVRTSNLPKKRGRKRTPESVQSLIDNFNGQLEDPAIDPVRQVELLQRISDLEAELEAMRVVAVKPEDLEEEFLSVVQDFSERRKITANAFRQFGVPASVIRKAGI